MIYIPPVSGADKNKQFQDLADQVMLAIARLIDPELRGIYANAVEADNFQLLSPNSKS
ncbi:MAG TPA: hypothetical protein G4N96_11065 [Chloroflexi bacterium]|nr:hypothetical protein [Chloroflexota bacterium]